MARRGTGGRPSKGDRDHIVSRPPDPIGEAVRASADKAGLSISEYVANVLATAHGLPEPYAAVHQVGQGVLPLGRTA